VRRGGGEVCIRGGVTRSMKTSRHQERKKGEREETRQKEKTSLRAASQELLKRNFPHPERGGSTGHGVRDKTGCIREGRDHASGNFFGGRAPASRKGELCKAWRKEEGKYGRQRKGRSIGLSQRKKCRRFRTEGETPKGGSPQIWVNKGEGDS